MSEDETKIHFIAKTCHEANRIWCQANNDFSQVHWNEAPRAIQESAIAGVRFKLENPDATPEDQHQSWFTFKEDEGWVYGPKKDMNEKTHPCMVPYDQLPEFQKKKDALFAAIVSVLR